MGSVCRLTHSPSCGNSKSSYSAVQSENHFNVLANSFLFAAKMATKKFALPNVVEIRVMGTRRDSPIVDSRTTAVVVVVEVFV